MYKKFKEKWLVRTQTDRKNFILPPNKKSLAKLQDFF